MKRLTSIAGIAALAAALLGLVYAWVGSSGTAPNRSFEASDSAARAAEDLRTQVAPTTPELLGASEHDARPWVPFEIRLFDEQGPVRESVAGDMVYLRSPKRGLIPAAFREGVWRGEAPAEGVVLRIRSNGWVPLTRSIDLVAAPSHDVTLERAVRAYGWVRDVASRTPVAQARIDVFSYSLGGLPMALESDVEPVETATTDATGRFELHRVEPGEIWSLRVLADGYAVGQREFSCAKQPNGRACELEAFELPRGRRMKVRVVDDVGRPIPSAHVVACWATKEGAPLPFSGGDYDPHPWNTLRSTTSEGGEVEFIGLPLARSIDLLVVHDHFVVGQTVALSSQTHATVRTSDEGTLDLGKLDLPEGDFQVWIARARTDGRFSNPGPVSHSQTVRISAGAYRASVVARDRVGYQDFDLRAGERLVLDPEWSSGASPTLRLVHAQTGAGVGGVAVSIRASFKWFDAGQVHVERTSSANGDIDLPGGWPTNDLHVSSQHPGVHPLPGPFEADQEGVLLIPVEVR